MQKWVINGKFLSQQLTGVQRYALEIIKELDKIVGPNFCELAVPSNAKKIPQLNNIKIVRVGTLKNQFWEQISLPFYILRKRAKSINLCNNAPLLFPGIVCIFDMKAKAKPEFFSKPYLLWLRILLANETKRAEAIITTSNFSKNEIYKYYHVPINKIWVIPSAWQHFTRVQEDSTVIQRFNLNKDYVFSMSSIEPNKNLRWIAETARKNPELQFIVAGSINRRIFSDNAGFNVPQNMKFLGYIKDEEAKCLIRNCKAFVFPTFYEGFGLPPLEAMSIGAKAIVSDTSCMREVYEDSAYYIDPNCPVDNIKQLLINPVGSTDKILNKYSWEKSARKLYELLCIIDK